MTGTTVMTDNQFHSTGLATSKGPSLRTVVLVVGVVWLGLFVLRLAGPSDMLDKDQLLSASYVLDVVQNGNWICQHDTAGGITSKPPLYTWAAAVTMWPSGRISRFALYLSTGLAALAMCWVILVVGGAFWGGAAGLFAALVFLVSTPTVKLMALARTDCFLGVMSALAALAAFRAWRLGRGWTWFWVAAGVATLAKGPLGAILAVGGLLAVLWEWRAGTPAPIRGHHAVGVALFLLISLGWFGLAYWQEGWPLVQKQIGRELIDHSVTNPSGDVMGATFYKSPYYFLTYFAPGSLVALLGFWRVWRRPSADDWTRRFERFLFCWFFFGMVLFTLAAHQRRDLLFPIYPPAALIVGRELARLAERVRPAIVTGVTAGTVGASLLLFFLVYHVWTAPLVTQAGILEETRDLEELARSLRKTAGSTIPITYTDCHYGLQYYLGTTYPPVSLDEAVELLRGDGAAFFAVHDPEGLKRRMRPGDPELHVVACYPHSGEPYASIVSNRPQVQWAERMAMRVGPILIQMDRLRLSRKVSGEFVFDAGPGGGTVTFVNHSDRHCEVRLRIKGPAREEAEKKLLGPEGIWRVSAAAKP